MITYVNSVLVSNYTTGTLASSLNPSTVVDGQFVIVDENGTVITSAANLPSLARKIKIGMFIGTAKTQYDHKGNAKPEIRWTNWIDASSVKSCAVLEAPASNAVTEDKAFIDLGNIDSNLLAKFAEGGKRFIVRLTFKDLPTRFRKWTESYEYITKSMSTADATAIAAAKNVIANGIADIINKQWKRARVVAKVGTLSGTTFTEGSVVAATGLVSGTVVQLEAMPYTDDNSVDSLNRFEKVRFNTNVYYTDPAADGWESLNKHFPTGVAVTKVPGSQYPASGKLVRDRENQALGYMGILNRGEGTWPIIQPAMRTDINANYNAITLEFENPYHTADDLMRKTKQTVEIYTKAAVKSGDDFTGIAAILSAYATLGTYNDILKTVDTTTEKGV